MKKDLLMDIPVTILREGNRFVAYSPVFDISTSGKTYKEVVKRFDELSSIYLEELVEAGTLHKTLSSFGWKRAKQGWQAPRIVGQVATSVRLPA